MSCECQHRTQTAANPIDVLKHEHRVIEVVLDAMEAMVKRDTIDRTFFEQALDFVRNFADGCHHAKEEDELFPILESAGIPREGGPIGCMLGEHELGRSYVKIIADHLGAAAAGDTEDVHLVRRAAREYIELLRDHIYKEDNVLFVMAGRVLGTHEQELMVDAFGRAERHRGAGNCHEHYAAIARDLARQAGTSCAVSA